MDGTGARGRSLHVDSFNSTSQKHPHHVLEDTGLGEHQKAQIFMVGWVIVIVKVQQSFLVLASASMSGTMGSAAASASSSM